MTGRWLFTLAQGFLFPLVFGTLEWAAGTPLSWWTVVNLVCWLPVMVLSIGVHEAGHTLVARLVGLEVRRVQIGIGRRLALLRLGSIEVEVSSLPFLGRTFPGGAAITRWRLALVLLAGPASSMLLAVALWKAASGEVSLHHPFGVIGVAAGLNGFLALLNALPWSRGVLRSDGLQVLMLPTLNTEQLAEYGLTPLLGDFERALGEDDVDLAARAVSAMQAQAPDVWVVRFSVATVALMREHYGEAARALEPLLGTAPGPTHRLMVLNNLAWTRFLLRDESQRDAALEASKEVLGTAPREPAFMSTRGAVLMWNGEFDAAIPLLEAAWLLTSAPAFRGNTAAVLTMAWARKGDATRAREWFERVSLRPESSLRREAEIAWKTAPTA
jgi:tetratricopeptide (TPR) repeat protein